MLNNKKILVAGGDLRNVHLAKLLAAGNTVYTIGLEETESVSGQALDMETLKKEEHSFDYIVFPVPMGSDAVHLNAPFGKAEINVDDILSLASEKTHILAGKIDGPVKIKLETQKIGYTDYLLREELAVLNAVPTAEGAVEIAMEELPVTIHGLDVLIVGYGRIAKVLAKILFAMGANVTVSARKFSDLAWIQAQGYQSVHTSDLETVISAQHLIYNTVPAKIFEEALLSQIKQDCLLIDLASKPGGIDFETAGTLGIKTIWALSLPGKVAPITAGKIIFDTIQNIDSERGCSLE